MQQSGSAIQPFVIEMSCELLNRRFPVVWRILFRYQLLYRSIQPLCCHKVCHEEACQRYPWTDLISQYSMINTFELVIRYKLKMIEFISDKKCMFLIQVYV